MTQPSLWLSIIFFIKYTSIEKANHLLNALKDKYNVSASWTASTYIGIDSKWDYDVQTVTLSISNYVKNAILKFKHERPSQSEHYPQVYNVPVYGAKIKYDTREESPEHLDDTERNVIQKIVATLLYYGIEIHNTILTALSDKATK